MSLKNIFDVFSRRTATRHKDRYEIPDTTRRRIFIWCAEVFGNRRTDFGTGDYSQEFIEQVHRFLCLRHGRSQLCNEQFRNFAEETLHFLKNCEGPEFLDFLEYIFRVECFFHVSMDKHDVVAELNELLRVDNLPYYVTDFVEVEEAATFHGSPATSIRTAEFPRVISRENEVIHTQIIEPALKVLQQASFQNANQEYLEALEDYRKGDLGDCLTKCGSALESTMKIICDKKRWPYSQNDTASALIKTIIKHSNLENFFESPLITVATLRNRLSKAHGAGTNARQVPRHFATYALNATASAIVLLASEAGFAAH